MRTSEVASARLRVGADRRFDPNQHTFCFDALASLALDRRDFNTFNMLQWFIAEQREELVLFRGIVDYMKLAGFTGGPGDALVNLDKFLLSQCHAH